MAVRFLIAAAALLAAAPAAAQSIPDTTDGIAQDLAYGYCPLYLAGQFPLTGNDQLKALGFTGTEQTGPNPRFGEVHFVEQKRDDLTVTFGGVPDKVCQVNLIGGGAKEIVGKVRANLSMLPFDFKPDAANSGDRNGAQVETLTADVQPGVIMGIQFVTADLKGNQMGSVQIYAMEK